MTDSAILAVTQGFEERFGYSAAGVWSAPGRVNLIGEHTDYNDGFVFPFAINRRTFAAVSLRTDGIARVASGFTGEVVEIRVSEISKDTVSGWSAYPLGVAWALLERSNATPQGFDCYLESDVPVGAGLSSSAAIECAVAAALNDLWEAGLDERDLARVGQYAENEIVGAPTGIMDQSASLLGQLDHGVFLDCRDLSAQVIDLGFAREGLELLIIDTRVEHRHADGGYASRRAACELGAATMGVKSLRDLSVTDLPRAQETLDDLTFRRVRHVVTENQRVLDTVAALKASGPRAIGQLLHESHVSMRDDFEINIDELDAAVETAIRHGAIGARMTGGGFGGAAIALCPVEKISEISNAIYAEFEALGFVRPEIFVVSAAPGAHREQ
ncbi:MAG: galactokinase [Micrococcales bacterium]